MGFGCIQSGWGVFTEYGSARFENASGMNGTADLGSDASIAHAGIRATVKMSD
ncbi:MAG: hypothetical protein ACI9G5_000546 [Paracoccaceae bacterium]